MIRLLASAAAVTLAWSAVASAQETSAPDERSAAAAAAQETGRLMGEVQQAIAVAQMQFVGMTGQAPDARFRGAVAVPAESAGVWDTVIVGSEGDGPDAPLVALAEYTVSGDRILSEVIHLAGQRPIIDGQLAALAQARSFAPRAVLAAGNNTFCADDGQESRGVTFATIVLPPRPDGSFDAYVLNGPIEDGAIPLGRHFRVGFDQFGLAEEPELVTDSCEVITWNPEDPDLAMSVYVTEHDGAAPTPVHAFLSQLLPMSLGVVTGDMIWPMAGGSIAPPVPAAEAGYLAAE